MPLEIVTCTPFISQAELPRNNVTDVSVMIIVVRVVPVTVWVIENAPVRLWPPTWIVIPLASRLKPFGPP